MLGGPGCRCSCGQECDTSTSPVDYGWIYLVVLGSIVGQILFLYLIVRCKWQMISQLTSRPMITTHVTTFASADDVPRAL